ncbi:leucyl/phenylalanyl-tRNA--protein transferase [soil metagenome]
MYFITDELYFPTAEQAEADGLIAIGGDLSPERLLLAYGSGIFPWEDDPVCWYTPDPRFVLFPEDLRITKSMQSVLRSGKFRFTINKAFEQVMVACSTVPRNGQNGTWISKGMIDAYSQLHQQGYAYSAEAWNSGELVGGLYGIKLGNIFFGESMFSKQSNASKFAFIKLIQYLQKQGLKLVDCQVHTDHLASLGARMISRKDFLEIVKRETSSTR